ncbi:lipoprotein-releasing ABC transporter permease subunit [Nitrospirillum viridazoti]|uniref:Lipoprotein-releasing system permease protein n=1 Tax=Nitrospirillum amazonense TaxID=28077 RepID=A0A560I8M2_9PROT|nr:lipoprotein-releasing ABC transporter permease subunit [Nitrospirillum amazonense]TWB54411.1 lipoprotein-releasing system permease protein [Nitrospirillum amazonense]
MIFSAFERMVAMRYLRARRQEGFISVIAGFSLLGIGLGVATLIIVMSVMNGFRTELLGRVLGLYSHLEVQSLLGPMPENDAVTQRLLTVPGVTAVMPTVEGQALITQDGTASAAYVHGITPEDFRRRPIVSTHLVEGAAEAFGAATGATGDEANLGDGIAIGSRMAKRLNLHVGDQLRLVSPRFNQTAFGSIPRARTYPIAAIFDVGMYDVDNSLIFMPLAAAQTFFGVANGYTSIEVFVQDPTHIDPYLAAATRAAGQEYRVYDWRQRSAAFVSAIDVERNVMFLILSLIILVAAFNVISSMIMLVKDKGRDIAILRTMGASRGMVLRIFFLTGASIGVVGTVFGMVLGVLFTKNIEAIRQFLQAIIGRDLFNAEIYFFTQIPAKLDWMEVTQVGVMALFLSFAATVYPSWRAARLDPVEALRYE